MPDDTQPSAATQLLVAFFGDWRSKAPPIATNANVRRFMRFANGDDSVIPTKLDHASLDALTRLLKGMRAQWQVSELYRQTIEAELRRVSAEVQQLGNACATTVMTPCGESGDAQSLTDAGKSQAFAQAAQMFTDAINLAYERAQTEWGGASVRCWNVREWSEGEA